MFSTFCFQGEQCFLFSVEVKSIYTSIPHEDGLNALCHFLVLQKIISLQCFSALKNGVAMGSNLERSFAIFLH